VAQIFESTDKRVYVPTIYDAVDAQEFKAAEGNLLDAGNLLCGSVAAGESVGQGSCKYNYVSGTAWCDSSTLSKNVARCAGMCKGVWRVCVMVCAAGFVAMCCSTS